jgi:very-short-patch-repair endonuclease
MTPPRPLDCHDEGIAMSEIALIHTARRRPTPDHVDARAAMEKCLADARLKLVETGTRNRLVHAPRGTRRTRALSVAGASADTVFRHLVREGKTLRFLAADETADDLQDLPRPKGPRLVTPRLGREIRHGLPTMLSADHLQKRLLGISRDAKAAEEERGTSILFLTIGFLRWYEDEKSEVPRHAPLVLVPVALVRDPRRSTFDLKLRDDEITTNQALQERLRGDFALSLPAIPESDDWTPSGYFEAVALAVRSKRRWSIDEELELGFASFSKHLMRRDLEPGTWPDRALLSHPLLRGLLGEGFAGEPPIFSEATNLDEVLAPAEIVQVVDADASQTKVIETVRAGRNLVVQGPPGTGKSQTIANIVASAVHDGKTVLFVAEKMAALDVVHARLCTAGLEDICLELHGPGVSKRLVAERLERTLQAAVPPIGKSCVEPLTLARDRLNSTASRLHRVVGDTGMTPYRALSIQISLAARDIIPNAALVAEAAGWNRADFDRRLALTAAFAALTASAGPRDAHPYFGVRRTKLQPSELQRHIPQLRSLAAATRALVASASEIGIMLGLDEPATLASVKRLTVLLRFFALLPPGSNTMALACAMAPSLRRVTDAATRALRWQAHQASFAGKFRAAAWSTPVDQLREPIAKGAASWVTRRGRAYQDACRSLTALLSVPLPFRHADRLLLLDGLIESRSLLAALGADAAYLANFLGPDWHGKETDFARLLAVARIIETIRAVEPRVDIVRAIASLRLDHDVFGSNRSKDMNVIDFKCLERDMQISLRNLNKLDCAGIPDSTFPHPALGAAPQLGTRLADELRDVAFALGKAIHALDLDIDAVFHEASVTRLVLEALADRAEIWVACPDRFEQWVRLVQADAALRAVGPRAIADGLAAGTLDPSRAAAEVEAAFAEACWTKAIEVDPELAAFEGTDHQTLVSRFAELESARRDETVQTIRARHLSAIPTGAQGAMGVIRGEIGRKRNHMPLRKLMASAGPEIQKIKPVFLMSPISVAQFLPPGAIDFDLLVIDEASQVRPAEALGAIARCRQIVVVGDKKQLPPTSFFDRLIADEADPRDDDDAEATPPPSSAAALADLESILSLCEARGLATRMLRWHYRSQHKSLIEVSNAEFYHHLVMPPAPTLDRSDMGLILRRVRGAYDRGGLRTNLVEAQAIVDAAAEHARAHPRRSLGIVTFSTAQRDLVCDLLDARRREDPVLDASLRDTSGEAVFVKNLENVQGDERDVILVSIGFGPREAGKPLDSMAFGPISAEGGERRLNVLFTRARIRCEIFVSFGAGDINLDRATGAGPRVLKRFLQYAETGELDERAPTGADFDSPFEATVAAAIERLGYKVDTQIGSAGFRIDLAVRDPSAPGRYLLAIECDGATYHSALWARERDRQRQEILERLGWRFHRIWSTDWFYRRAAQIDRLKAALDAARRRADLHPVPSRLCSSSPPEPSSQARIEPRQPAYALAHCVTPIGHALHSATPAQLAGIIETVIEREGPIHRDEIVRRVAAFFGKQRIGKRVGEAVARGMAHLETHAPHLGHETDFWFTERQRRAPPVRDRSAAPLALRRLDKIARLEISAAIEIARRQDPHLDESNLADFVAALLGLKKASQDLQRLVRSLTAESALGVCSGVPAPCRGLR